MQATSTSVSIPESHGSAEVHEKPRFGPSIKGFEWDDPSNTVRTSEGKLDIDFGKILESYMTTGYAFGTSEYLNIDFFTFLIFVV